MYNIAQRKIYRLDPAQVEQETYQNLLSLTGIDPVIAEIMEIDIKEELTKLRQLAHQLTINLLRQEGDLQS